MRTLPTREHHARATAQTTGNAQGGTLTLLAIFVGLGLLISIRSPF